MRAVFTDEDLKRLKKDREAAKKPLGLGEAPSTDDYLAQLSKYIPAEILTFYVAIFAAANQVKDSIPYGPVCWLMFGIGIIGTVVITYTTNIKDLKDTYQVNWGIWPKTSISIGAFIVWAFVLGGPFSNISGYNAFYGTLLMMTYTLIAPRLYDLYLATLPTPTATPTTTT